MSVYSEDLRQRVRKYVENGGSQKEASAMFGVTTRTIYNWLKNSEPAKKSGRKNPVILDNSILIQYVNENKDRTLHEYSQHFNVSINAIWKAFKRLGIVKKTDALSGKNVYEKV